MRKIEETETEIGKEEEEKINKRKLKVLKQIKIIKF